tara:strand:+ start:4285 stop:5598 length:1314 start_codon:yes stop_codon:yes gene_type:complete
MKQHTLLASQDDMLARLVHNLNYGDGVVILSGDQGSGRSTVALSLFEQLDTYNQAFVACPQQTTLAEIRQKIVPQFFTNPLYNNEDAISDTIVRLANGHTHSMLLVLDDADYLPQEVMDELLLLSHLQAHGIRLRIILIVKNESLLSFKRLIPKKYHAMMLPFNMQPLNLKERQELYCRLVERTEPKPALSLDLIQSFLARQSGKPDEIVGLVQQALHHPESLEHKHNTFMLKLVSSIIIVLALLIAAGFLFLDPKINMTTYLEQHDEKTNEILDPEILPSKTAQTKQEVTLPIEDIDISVEEPKPTPHIVIETASVNTIDAQPAQAHTEENAKLTESLFSLQQGTASIPKSGYTIQLAAVKNIASLTKVWQQTYSRQKLFLFKRAQGFILLLGQFPSREAAQQITEQFNLESEVWIRSWKNIPTKSMQRLILNDAI